MVIGYSAMIFMLIVFKIKKRSTFFDLFIKFVALFIVFRYLYWRTFETLVFENIFDSIGMMLLYSAELFAISIYVLGLFTSLSILNRKSIDLKEFEEKDYPTVDVLITTYNEPYDIIEKTVLAAVDLDYPKIKFAVYLLDDGGTAQKCNSKKNQEAEEAQKRKKYLQEFCEKAGAIYLTREKNENAKAGNINTALSSVTGELILMLDADHIPAPQFLQKTIGWFLKDEKMFLVQTPHSFYNPDPVERNLRMAGVSQSENDMFYKYIQKGHDFWQSSFFCGSAAVLRRKFIDEIGGIAGETITEDAETAIGLHNKGYRSAYVDEPMVRGLQAETFSALVLQRVRWTQGMVQIFILKNPFLSKGLKWHQKMSYISACFFWFFAYSRVVFFISPLLFLFFGLKIYNATGTEVLAYVVPHMFMAISMSYFLYSKVRNPFFSELYETVLSFFTLPAIISTLFNPRNPTFKVTPKGHEVAEDYVSELGGVFVVVFIVIVLGVFASILRLIFFPEYIDVILITGTWNLLNLILILAAMGVVSEKKEVRQSIRIPLHKDVKIFMDNKDIYGSISDISEGGAKIKFKNASSIKDLIDSVGYLDLVMRGVKGEEMKLQAKFLHTIGDGGDAIFTFKDVTNDFYTRTKLIQLIYGNTTNWQMYEDQKPVMNPLRSFIYIIKQTLTNVMFKEMFKQFFIQNKNKQKAGL